MKTSSAMDALRKVLNEIESDPQALFEASITLPLCEWTPVAMLLDGGSEPMSPLATAVLIEVRKKFLAQLHNAREMR